VKKLQVVIRPDKLDLVKHVLRPWVTGLTVTEVKGHGRQRGHTELYRGGEYTVELLPKYLVEVVVPTPLVLRAVHELEHALHTGRIGDGKIFVGPVDQAIRVRTGERGEDAL